MPQPTSIEARKAEIRREALARREALPPEERAAAAEAIAARGLPVALQAGQVVSGFSPIKSEISPVPLMRRFAEAGARLALPVIVGRGRPLLMRAWRFGERLSPGVWGIREPGSEQPELDPDVLIVPILAFDRTGHRLGYGAGYYDMTITTLRGQKPITAIGIAYAAQEVPALPTTPRDARLDLVLTEREVISCKA